MAPTEQAPEAVAAVKTILAIRAQARVVQEWSTSDMLYQVKEKTNGTN